MNSVSIDHDIEQAVTVAHKTGDRNWLARGGVAYVAAWMVGLSVKPAGVTTNDGGAVIARHYVEHRMASIVQVLLVHAAAAVALAVFAVGLSRLARMAGLTRAAQWCRRTTTVAVIVSFVQAVAGVVMITTAGSFASSTTRGLLLGVERLDAVKLIALAGLCGVGLVLGRRGLLSRWTGRVATAAIVCLLAAAVALAGLAAALTPIAVPALVLLLVWVGGVGFTARQVGA